MQGIDFAPDGTLYASEQGPKTDDEVNILKPGANYGWPHVAGVRDGKAYEYARWAESTTPCTELSFSDLAIPPPCRASRNRPSPKPSWSRSPPCSRSRAITTFTTRPAKAWTSSAGQPSAPPASNIIRPRAKGIPGWDRVLLITTLKRGSLYVLPLTADGQAAAGHMSRYFQSENRYRDTASQSRWQDHLYRHRSGRHGGSFSGRRGEKNAESRSHPCVYV